MLNYKVIAGIVGVILLSFGFILLIPMLVGLMMNDEGWWTFGGTAIIGIAIGLATWNIYRPELELNTRDAFAVVGLSWVFVAVLGALPFFWGNLLPNYADAILESVSGLTATGITVFGSKGFMKLEDVPYTFLFWRSLLQWLGSLSIIILATAYLPFLGIGGMQLFRSEVTGPTANRLAYRFRTIASRTWILYSGITIVLMLLLTPAMDFDEAACYALSTVSTGGFMTRSTSISSYNSPYLEWILILFMFIGGINFNFIYHAVVNQDFKFFKRRNFIVYLWIIVSGALLVGLSLYQPVADLWIYVWGGKAPKQIESLMDAIRIGAFQVVSLASTTGFKLNDQIAWTPFCFWVFVVVSVIGGMAGSGAGGVKVIRIVLILKQIAREIKLLLHPKAVISIRIDQEVVSADIMRSVSSFVMVFLLTIFMGMGFMSLCGIDLISGFYITISAISGVGPALSELNQNTSIFGTIPLFGKLILMFLMMLGRLEIFTLLLLLTPTYWHK